MYQNLFDSHTHSENSLDGAHSVVFMVEKAVEKGVQGIAITDHCECEELEQRSCAARLRMTAMDVARAREAFGRRIIITSGIELGQPQHDYAGAQRMLEMQGYDFVLLALHRLRGRDDFYDMDFSGMSESDLHAMMLQYFAELLEIVRWGNFDSLAHLSFPLRYPLLRNNIRIDLTRYAEPVDEVLRALAESGKALELNTSGLRQGMRDTLPPAWVVHRFRELGGEMVTIGSDAHTAGEIGAGIRDGMHLLLENGFEQFAFFRDRKPVMLRII